MAAPAEYNGIMKVAVGDDTIPATRVLDIQAMSADEPAVVVDGNGQAVWEAATAGNTICFPFGIGIRGLNVTGTGPVYVYLK
jgi:hypothetical protein